MVLANKVIYQNGAIREFEKPEVCEAIKVANENRWTVALTPTEWDEREARLKKEYEENTKAPGPGGEQPNEGNPALAESASQFNDALLDEQAKKIAELTEEKERLEDKITIFNIFKKRNDEAYRRQIRSLDKEISKLNGIIHDKNAVLSDVAEELRLSKIREKNLTEVSQKYVKEVEDLKKELDEANKHQQQAYRSCADKNKEIRALKLQISALEKRGNGIDWKRNADAIKLYVNRASHERLWSPISQDICNEQELSFIINHGGKRVKYALRFDGTDIVYECSDPDKKPSFFRDDSVGAVTNQKDCSPVKDTHPTEDNPEEIEIEKADKVVDKIDAQALKSAESALAWKENVIDKLAKENNYYKKCVEEFRNKIADMTIGKIDIQNIRLKEKNKEIKELNDKLKSINKNRHNELAEKDDVIADLGKELTESKKRVEWVRNASKEYCDYGVSANEFIKELAHLYVLASNNGNINGEMLERCKNYQAYGFPANCNRETKKEINDIARGKTKVVGVDIAEEGEDHSGVIVLCGKDFIDAIKKMK